MSLATHLKQRLRAQQHDKTATASSLWHRRKALWGWGLLAIGGLVVLLNLLGPQRSLFLSSRSGGLRAAGGTRGAVLLPRRAVKQVLYDCGAGCSSSGLLVLQTSDGRGRYARMLDATQGVQLAYAQQWGFSYLRWDGVVKGRQAWHATYNRIYLLHELYRLRHQHRYRWVLFMDPGACVF
jgi:hypothetical protein